MVSFESEKFQTATQNLPRVEEAEHCSYQQGIEGVQGLPGQKGVKGRRGPPGKPGIPDQQTPGQHTQLLVQRRRSQNKTSRKLPRNSRFDEHEEWIGEEWHSHSWHLGTKDSPATNCRELSLIHPHIRDGHYYIDPNQGCPFDALNVFCNFTAGGLTCVSPVQSKTSGIWSSWDTKKGFSEQYRGFKFEYRDLDVVQLRFLRLNSNSAIQNITLTCPKNHSPTAKHRDMTKRVVHLLGDSSEEIDPSLVTISKRGCEVVALVRVLSNLELHRGDMQLLPIRAISIEGRGDTWEEDVSIVLGPLCFL
ncbi:collagen alpha-1(XI) chain-like [Xyrauchen texanus]|uniref:collagen alpha-1(XI) chain-like n=1 Tax=Xyrauchen texanus TaxID=154827 RepID=UPI0022418C8B|nr:collagen alpha-1(XI) chain-like [Xyrauchen texanus]